MEPVEEYFKLCELRDGDVLENPCAVVMFRALRSFDDLFKICE